MRIQALRFVGISGLWINELHAGAAIDRLKIGGTAR